MPNDYPPKTTTFASEFKRQALVIIVKHYTINITQLWQKQIIQ